MGDGSLMVLPPLTLQMKLDPFSCCWSDENTLSFFVAKPSSPQLMPTHSGTFVARISMPCEHDTFTS